MRVPAECQLLTKVKFFFGTIKEFLYEGSPNFYIVADVICKKHR